MFYSETLLSKTGPLARVWLSANLERKLSKTHILQSNIETSVGAIVGQDQAPMALRLSGQLLLGVVRIYSRKARYLLEDCNEALMKIKMAFRPGNVDLPAGAISHTSAQLTLPDVITELDLLLPDPTLDLGDLGNLPFQSGHQKRNADITLDPESFVSSLEQGRGFDYDDGLQLEDDILDIDIGEDRDMTTIGVLEDLMQGSDSLEIGRDAPLARDIREDLFDESRMSLDLDLGVVTPKARQSMPPPGLGFEEDPLDLGFGDDNNGFAQGMDLDFEGDTTIRQQEVTPIPEAPASVAAPEAEAEAKAEEAARERAASVAPLPPVSEDIELPAAQETDEMVVEPGDATFVADNDSMRLSSEDPEAVHARQQMSRKRKVVVDPITEIKAKVIKAQQSDRSRILKEPSFLPRDPTMLALMSLTRTGGLARSIFYPKNIAPELANLLAPDFVKRMADLKRKRDAGDEQEARPSPPKQARLEIEEEEHQPEPEFHGHEMEEERPAEEIMEMPADVSTIPFLGEEEDYTLPQRREGTASPQPQIIPQGEVTIEQMEAMGEPAPEEPSAPQVPQPVSRETRHAVHVLREQFAEPNPKSTVRFQELLPPQTTTKIDATKMFFEVLVLATKDAVKVKQRTGFGAIEIQQKKALWGAWAEEKDEQQVAEEEERLHEAEKEARRTREVVVGTGRTVGEAIAAA